MIRADITFPTLSDIVHSLANTLTVSLTVMAMVIIENPEMTQKILAGELTTEVLSFFGATFLGALLKKILFSPKDPMPTV